MGVWGEKSMYGRKYMGTFRTTFIISPDGIIEKVFTPEGNQDQGACSTDTLTVAVRRTCAAGVSCHGCLPEWVSCVFCLLWGYMVWRYVSMPFSAEEPVRIYIPGGASDEDIRGILDSSTGAGYGGRVYMLWKKMDGTPSRSHGS